MNNLVLLDGNKISGGINYLSPECYSTEEREVGCWIDGKPLYQKTYNISMSARSENTVNVDSNFANKTLISFKINPDGIANTKVGYNGSVSDTLYVDNGNLYYYFSKSGQWWGAFNSADLTIWYTKTTDVAGSGDWTPSGIPTVHYSTEEHVVGTWIDGSTLYEKTIEIGSVNASQSKDVAHNISNFGMLVDFSCVAINTAENKWNVIPRVDNADTYQRGISVSNSSITIGQSSNAQALTNCYATLRYTKSS